MAALAREQWLRHFRLAALLMIFGLWAIAPPAAAQQASAGVNGVVTDPTGAVVSGAQISLVNVDTNVVRTTTANNDGAYVFINVVPGNYTIKVAKPGFSGVTEPGLRLEVNQTATFDFRLKVGETQTSVTVEATGASVEAATSELGTVVANQEVVELPLNGRNFTQLLTITPGVANVNRDQSAGGGGSFVGAAIGSFSFPAINGARVRSNSFLLDGVNDLNTFLTTYNFAPIIDDIQEFKTQGHNDLAEYGGVMGGIVSVVSKSGTNQYHGTMWEFLRNQVMDARGFFNGALAPLRENQFGVAGGGPIRIPKLYNGKNRTFFYAAYEAYRQRTSSEGGAFGPTDAERGGDFSALLAKGQQGILYDPNSSTYNAGTNSYSRTPLAGNLLPQNELSPIALAYQALVPHVGALLNGNNIYEALPAKTNQDTGSVRADQYFGNSDQIMFRYSQYEQIAANPAGPLGVQNVDVYGQNIAAHETHTFGPTAVLDVYVGRNFGNDVETNSGNGMNSTFLSNINSLGMSTTFETLSNKQYAPMMGFSGYVGWPNSALQATSLANVWQFGGSFTKIIGTHTIKFGGDIETNNFHSPIGYDTEGFSPTQTAGLGVDSSGTSIQGVGGDAWASFLLGVPNGASLRNVNEVANGGRMGAAFVQDQWKATSRLTVNIGFRYDLRLWPIYGSGKDLYTGDANPVTGQYILTAVPPNCSASVGAPCMPNGIYAANGPDPYTGLPPNVVVAGSNHAILKNDYKDFSGRLGLAYRINDKMVARAGYGRFYDMWGGITQLAQNFGGNWPAVATINNPSLNQNTITAGIKDPLSLGGGGGLVYPRVSFDQVSQWMVDPNFKSPYMDQWNFGVQREMPSGIVADVNYVGSVGRRLDWGPVQNVPLPGPGPTAPRQPYPYMLPQWFDQSVGASRYNSLQVSINKRASRNLAFQVSYTLSKSIDDGCGIGAQCNAQNIYNRTSDVEISDTNQTNTFSTSFTLQSPWGKPGAGGNKALNTLVNGWSLNGIVQLHSGLPYTVVTNTAILNDGGLNNERANIVANPTSGGGTVAEWFNVANYSNPPAYTFGNSKPNSLVTDWGKNLDLSLFRQFHLGLGEARYFEFRAEAFNVLNNVEFGYPNNNLANPNPGQVTSQLNAPRQLQMGLKFYF